MRIESRTERPGALRQVVRLDAHTLHADAPVALGGGTAPTPHDYFDASLAACKALVASIYAREHGIALERTVVEIDRDDSQERKGTYVLNVRLTFEGALSAEERVKLRAVADRCPIAKLMTSSTVEIREVAD